MLGFSAFKCFKNGVSDACGLPVWDCDVPKCGMKLSRAAPPKKKKKLKDGK